jgi:hypothetical protein
LIPRALRQKVEMIFMYAKNGMNILYMPIMLICIHCYDVKAYCYLLVFGCFVYSTLGCQPGISCWAHNWREFLEVLRIGSWYEDYYLRPQFVEYHHILIFPCFFPVLKFQCYKEKWEEKKELARVWTAARFNESREMQKGMIDVSVLGAPTICIVWDEMWSWQKMQVQTCGLVLTFLADHGR